jgi:putative membrane-bound dehydrogenase-like protein
MEIALRSFVILVVALWPVVRAAESSIPKVREPWRMELVASAPQIRHPSVVCVAADGRIFVAEDPMDINAPADSRQGRVIWFHPDGSRSVYATNLYAVFGMQYLEGKLYVLHNPELTVFVDGGKQGTSSEKLIESTNPNPWALDWNDHVPANFKLAMDGYFYFAVGDKGIYGAKGKDGRQIFLHGAGIVRMRPNGTGLEIYCTGVRNILDVALTTEDEIFTYDNTDEHDWMGRLTHMVDGGYYGYPFDFVPRQKYTLWMMHDFGGGAATGTFAYTEDALPEEFRDNLFLADFGKRQILRVKIEREGATFKVRSFEEMFIDPPEEFRPVGICLGADGKSIYVCDWQHRDTKENVEVGRLWKLTYGGKTREAAKPSWYVAAALGKPQPVPKEELKKGLEHSARSVRLEAQRLLERAGDSKTFGAVLDSAEGSQEAKWHAIWGLAGTKTGTEKIASLSNKGDSGLKRQALRALAAGGDEAKIWEALKDKDAAVRFQAATTLGRIGTTKSVPRLLNQLQESDFFAGYALFHSLNEIGRRQSEAWVQIAKAIENSDEGVRERAIFAMRETYDPALVAVLGRMVESKTASVKARIDALELAAAVVRKLPEWKGEWWAYHPALGEKPKKTSEWSETGKIEKTISVALNDRETELRKRAAQMVGEFAITNLAAASRDRFSREPQLEVRREILKSLASLKDNNAAPLVTSVLSDRTNALLEDGIKAAKAINSDEIVRKLRGLLNENRSSEQTVLVLETLGELKTIEAAPDIITLTGANDRAVKIAAVEALGRIGGPSSLSRLSEIYRSSDTELKGKAVAALSLIKDPAAVPILLEAWANENTRQTAYNALLKTTDVRALAVYLEALQSSNPTVREQGRKALKPLRDQVAPALEPKLKELNQQAIAELQSIYENHPFREKCVFAGQGSVPLTDDYKKYAMAHKGDVPAGQRLFRDEKGVACIRCHAVSGQGGTVGPDLTIIGTQFPRETLIDHVLFPSAAVREGYQQVMFELQDGDSISGIVKAESDENVTILDSQGQKQTLPKREIHERRKSELSLMPEGLQAGLSLEQFTDLIAYLESLRSDATQRK